MYVPLAPFYNIQAFWRLSVPVEMSAELEHAHPTEIPNRGLMHPIYCNIRPTGFPIKW